MSHTALDSMTQRLASMGLAVFHPDSTGAVLASPSAGPAHDWLIASDIPRHVDQAMSRWEQEGGDPLDSVTPIEGLLLTPLPGDAATGRVALVAAYLDRRLLDLRPTEDAADEAAALAALIQPTPPNPDHIRRSLGWMWDDLGAAEAEAATTDQLSEQLIQSYEETRLTYRISRLMNVSRDPRQALEMICQQILAIQPFSWVALTFRDTTRVTDLRGDCIMAGQPPCAPRALQAELSAMLDGLDQDNWVRILDPGQHSIASLVGAVVLAEPIHHDDEVIGILATGNKYGPDAADVSSFETQFFDASAELLGTYHENLARFFEQQSMFLGTLKALTAAIDAKDRYTCGHSERVAWLASQTAKASGLDEVQVEQVRIAGLVHDVGKIGVREAVLLKSGRLTDEEFAEIKKHPEIGEHPPGCSAHGGDLGRCAVPP